VFLLILESFGSTELLFILVMALVFFGPRKLPQISRSLGKSMAEFRRASEDFKRTWEKEVAMEPFADPPDSNLSSRGTNLLESQPESVQTADTPTEYTIARERKTFADETSNVNSDPPANAVDQNVPSQKRDWL
jgi:sec-independent protein translocase protein TatB